MLGGAKKHQDTIELNITFMCMNSRLSLQSCRLSCENMNLRYFTGKHETEDRVESSESIRSRQKCNFACHAREETID